MNCEVCRKEVDLPFQCSFCEGYFCREHRLPENHMCLQVPPRTPIEHWKAKKSATFSHQKEKWNEPIHSIQAKPTRTFKPPRPYKKIIVVSSVLFASIAVIALMSPSLLEILQRNSGTIEIRSEKGAFYGLMGYEVYHVKAELYNYGKLTENSTACVKVTQGENFWTQKQRVSIVPNATKKLDFTFLDVQYEIFVMTEAQYEVWLEYRCPHTLEIRSKTGAFFQPKYQLSKIYHVKVELYNYQELVVNVTVCAKVTQEDNFWIKKQEVSVVPETTERLDFVFSEVQWREHFLLYEDEGFPQYEVWLEYY